MRRRALPAAPALILFGIFPAGALPGADLVRAGEGEARAGAAGPPEVRPVPTTGPAPSP